MNSGERYVRAACAKLFLLFGPSLFGLRKHLNFNELEIIITDLKTEMSQSSEAKLLYEQLELVHKLILDIQKISQN